MLNSNETYGVQMERKEGKKEREEREEITGILP
jgi:hypothetical protein